MEHNDYFFYLVVALSVVGSIVKALKKKPNDNQTEPKTSVGGDILKKILAEMQEKDDYIPRNPAPAPAAKQVVKQPVIRPSVEKGYNVAETKQRQTIPDPSVRSQIFEPVEEFVDPFMASLDLSSTDEMKKAIIYSEILRPKF